MKEFGSDFHYIEPNKKDNTSLVNVYPNARYYFLGRHPIIDVIKHQSIKRIWIPYYYCYDVLHTINKLTACEVCYYKHYPTERSLENSLRGISFRDGDLLLVVNYFGITPQIDASNLGVMVIEDHSHDLLSNWAKNSSADWCFASIRKTMPIAQGGILWSPKGKDLPMQTYCATKEELNSMSRYLAMSLKSLYLNDIISNKSSFRELYIKAEESYDNLDISGLDCFTMEYIRNFDIVSFYKGKKENLIYIYDALKELDIEILKPNDDDSATPFSLILLFNSKDTRDKVRLNLISEQVYPAILWPIEENDIKAQNINDCMLSIHCDSRYVSSKELLANIIIRSIKNV